MMSKASTALYPAGPNRAHRSRRQRPLSLTLVHPTFRAAPGSTRTPSQPRCLRPVVASRDPQSFHTVHRGIWPVHRAEAL
ncbi:hypothetical protein GCM10023319_69910 [Nocardia iowensis]